MSQKLLIRQLGRQPYEPVWKAMKAFTEQRDSQSADEIWLVEHEPVFTLGQAGKMAHVLTPGQIPVIKTDRGGQVTYHGPGQLVVYLMLNVRRIGSGPRALVTALENSVINLLNGYGIHAHAKADAPGVYVGDAKLASLGLRFRKMCSYHGLALNIDMNLEPFQRINPCGYPDQQVVTLKALYSVATLATVSSALVKCLLTELGYTDYLYTADSSVFLTRETI
ncbi:MAG: lipoyl(octanoyl) transferase LipB [Endozoicomonas sp. (ex Botrylloides leachii)]|nr:lipoyl(octanoyl) transferase LipB [Endozoicomonas sp. (ex Botrylloides leachii)]